jgi:hypothetical protein
MKLVIGIVAVFFFGLASPPTYAQQWDHFTSKDEMTGELKAFATSPRSSPTQPLGFPYHNFRGWLGFGCDRQNEWAFIGFTTSPNLTSTEPHSGGYSAFSTRIRWDDSVQSARMMQQWGDRFLLFRDDAAAITSMMNARTVLLELSWYGSGNIYFHFSLDGSTDAINGARTACRGIQRQSKPKMKDTAPDSFASVLNTVEALKQKAPKPLSISEIDLARQQLARCWSLPAGAKDAEDLVIEIHAVMNPDGTVREARIVDQLRMQQDPFFRAAAESALRAALNPRCSPLRLPPEKYEQWKDMTLNFNAKEMF